MSIFIEVIATSVNPLPATFLHISRSIEVVVIIFDPSPACYHVSWSIKVICLATNCLECTIWISAFCIWVPVFSCIITIYPAVCHPGSGTVHIVISNCLVRCHVTIWVEVIAISINPLPSTFLHISGFIEVVVLTFNPSPTCYHISMFIKIICFSVNLLKCTEWISAFCKYIPVFSIAIFPMICCPGTGTIYIGISNRLIWCHMSIFIEVITASIDPLPATFLHISVLIEVIVLAFNPLPTCYHVTIFIKVINLSIDFFKSTRWISACFISVPPLWSTLLPASFDYRNDFPFIYVFRNFNSTFFVFKIFATRAFIVWFCTRLILCCRSSFY